MLETNLSTEIPGETKISNERIQKIITSLSKCKIVSVRIKKYQSEANECKKLRDKNLKLEIDLKEVRELEKSHRIQLSTSREMIENLQETVSQLVYLKRDAKKLKEELIAKDSAILLLEKDKENLIYKHNENTKEIFLSHEKQIEEIKSTNETKIQQVQHDSDTQIAQFTCVVEELRCKMKDMEAEHRDKMNVLVLDYEEKIQRSAAQVAQLQEQLSRQAALTDANIDAYRRRLEDLEEKLKQSQFKHYLAQSTYPSQYESQGERPYSVDRNQYTQDFRGVVSSDQIEDCPKKLANFHNKTPRSANPLQVTYYGNKTPIPQKSNEKKGQFNITKKRKLYSDKEFQDLQ